MALRHSRVPEDDHGKLIAVKLIRLNDELELPVEHPKEPVLTDDEESMLPGMMILREVHNTARRPYTPTPYGGEYVNPHSGVVAFNERPDVMTVPKEGDPPLPLGEEPVEGTVRYIFRLRGGT